MNRSPAMKSNALPLLLIPVAVLGTGCVAFNVGRPETFRHGETVFETAKDPSSSEILDAKVSFSQPRADVAEIGLLATVRETYPRTSRTDETTVVRQKRMSFGFLPFFAENDGPDDTLVPSGFYRNGRTVSDPELGRRYVYKTAEEMEGEPGVFLAGLCLIPGMYVNSVVALVWTPFFGDWECNHVDWVERKNCRRGSFGAGRLYYDTATPALYALSKFPEEDRRRIGVRTCYDPGDTAPSLDVITHWKLFGFHKFLRVWIRGPVRGTPVEADPEIRTRRGVAVPGPISVRVFIPEVGWTGSGVIDESGKAASVALPSADRDRSATATVTVSAPGGLAGEACGKAAGSTWSFPVSLKAGASGLRPSVPAVVTQVVVHVTEPAAEPAAPKTAPWDIETVRPYADGRAEWLVTVRDPARTALEVRREVRPDLEASLRESFCAANPGIDAKAVRAYVSSDFGANRTIRLLGVAFSVAPVADGWSYDADTRRGTVRLRVSAHMRPEDAKQWARENVSAIVAEKNVSLEAGKAPPDGATYRSLSESLENGVLSVEFEAVE